MGKAVRGLTMLSKSRPLPDVFVDQMTLIIHPSRHRLPLSLVTVNFLINLGFFVCFAIYSVKLVQWYHWQCDVCFSYSQNDIFFFFPMSNGAHSILCWWFSLECLKSGSFVWAVDCWMKCKKKKKKKNLQYLFSGKIPASQGMLKLEQQLMNCLDSGLHFRLMSVRWCFCVRLVQRNPTNYRVHSQWLRCVHTAEHVFKGCIYLYIYIYMHVCYVCFVLFQGEVCFIESVTVSSFCFPLSFSLSLSPTLSLSHLELFLFQFIPGRGFFLIMHFPNHFDVLLICAANPIAYRSAPVIRLTVSKEPLLRCLTARLHLVRQCDFRNSERTV